MNSVYVDVQKYYNLLVHLRHIYYTDTCKVYKNQL